MRRLLPTALAAGLLVGCGPYDVEVDVPARSRDDAVAIERLPATDDLPRRYRATWKGDALGPEKALVALRVRASELCRGEDTVYLDGTGDDLDGTAAGDLALVFHCVPETLPGLVELDALEAVPEQPALGAGQQRKHAWAAALGYSADDAFESLFGDMVRDIQVEACGERATTLHRVATYVQHAEKPRPRLTHVYIDYSCAEPEAS